MTKSELEEKIKNGESVWIVNGCSVKEVDFSKIEKKDIVLDYILFGSNQYRLVIKRLLDDGDSLVTSYYKYTDIFATQEKAEWGIEFGNIKKIEMLKLPTWKEFNKIKTKLLKFPHFNFFTNHIEYRLLGDKKNNEIKLIEFASHKPPIFESTYTKENYIEACRLCKKLSLNGGNDG